MLQMSPEEEELFYAIKWRDDIIRRADKMVDRLREAVNKKGCSHSETIDWEWEHDNGYGRQSRMKGLLCVLCRRINHWPGMSNHWSESPF